MTLLYAVPVEHGGPTPLEVASHVRTQHQWATGAYDFAVFGGEGRRHQGPYTTGVKHLRFRPLDHTFIDFSCPPCVQVHSFVPLPQGIE